ncbi:MAG TPA: TetR/AcrR family transcriptional regulator [Ktedonobacteraceae bacterium]|jgi:AcrR family transcriptional regulator|nr:TetR/AcrR family transcriptional regulator [Ktedonobacteraceae bacterium]
MREDVCEFPWPPRIPQPLALQQRHERRDAAEHRQRILEVARRLFAEQGVEAVSMHQIATAAGIGQGTLYRRYAHKGALCMDLLRESHEQFVGEITRLLADRKTAPVLERLDNVLSCMVAFLEEQGAFLGAIAAANARHWLCDETDSTRQPGPSHGSLREWLHAVLVALLAEAVEKGELAALDIPYVADAILITVNPMFYRFQRQERGYSPERILQGLRRIYIEGVKPPK